MNFLSPWRSIRVSPYLIILIRVPVENCRSCVQGNDFWFCWTVRNWSLFLTHQLIGTNVCLPKMHKVPVDVDFESSRSPAKSESWNSPNLHCLAVFPTWQNCLYSLVWWIYEINRCRRLSQTLVHFVIDRASLFTEHRISGLPIRAKYKHFRTIW